MIDNRLLSVHGPETAARVRVAISELDPRGLEILEKLDHEHRLQYLLADSEADRMAIHRNYWREKFGGAAKAIAGLSIVPGAVGAMLSVTTGVLKTTGDDAVLLGAMTVAMAGAATVVHLIKEKAVEVTARHVEGKGAKLIGPAMADFAPLPKVEEHPAEKLASLGARTGAGLSEGELGVLRIAGRIVSASLAAQCEGRKVAESQLREWGSEVNAKLAELGRRDPLAARRSAQRLGAVLTKYGIDIETAQHGFGVGAPSRRFAME